MFQKIIIIFYKTCLTVSKIETIINNIQFQKLKLGRGELMYLSIKTVRLQKKVLAKTICELIGVKRITYYKKESGTVKFSLDEAKKISDYFKMPIEEIFLLMKFQKVKQQIAKFQVFQLSLSYNTVFFNGNV